MLVKGANGFLTKRHVLIFLLPCSSIAFLHQYPVIHYITSFYTKKPGSIANARFDTKMPSLHASADIATIKHTPPVRNIFFQFYSNILFLRTIIRPAPSGAGRTTPEQTGHYPLNNCLRLISIPHTTCNQRSYVMSSNPVNVLFTSAIEMSCKSYVYRRHLMKFCLWTFKISSTRCCFACIFETLIAISVLIPTPMWC